MHIFGHWYIYCYNSYAIMICRLCLKVKNTWLDIWLCRIREVNNETKQPGENENHQQHRIAMRIHTKEKKNCRLKA